MTLISKNLRHLRKEKGLTQDQLADLLGIKRSLVGAYEEGRAEPPIQNLKNITKVFGVSVDDFIEKKIFSRKGINPLTGQIQDSNVEFQGTRLKILALTVDKDENEHIDFIPQKAAAGYSNGYSDPEFLKEMPKFHLPNLPTGTYRAFEVSGDSMLPVSPGSILVGKYIPELGDIKDGDRMVLLTKTEGIVFKRIKKHSNKAIKLISDNPEYDPYILSFEDILEIWKVVLYVAADWPGPLEKNNPDEPIHKGEQILEILQDLKKEVRALKKV
jgi:transcriptional regulator with XRE-family HTH domain